MHIEYIFKHNRTLEYIFKNNPSLSLVDGQVYCLRRVDRIRTSQDICQAVCQLWQQLKQPTSGILTLYQAFVSHGALYLLRQYVPGAQSVKSHFFSTNPQEVRCFEYFLNIF